ncbi:MAG TPA: adenylate/guanylate cyclase domain-containing protein, partial [Acidimicrobiia bacterium]|nr:adenylate/guanylate cyclase domain-containing protein [Acidimicrobiia bacterium]
MNRTHAPPLPTGTVTFVLADLEGSVRLWESLPEAMATATARLDDATSELIRAHRGVRPVEQGEGDSFVAAFPMARDAVEFAIELLRTLHASEWATALPLRMRIGIHTGAAQLRGDDNYMGPSVNRCARLRALAHGGQVLVSEATGALVADDLVEDVSLLDLGMHALRGFDRPEHVFQLVHADLPQRFPPLRDERGIARLPTTLTTFVAREREMVEVGNLLAAGRLVTLTGSGGAGKTRLALESAHQQATAFADGVAWVDAAPLGDGALLTSSVAAALGIREVPAEPLIDTVVREVADRNILLVVDNCEHVIDDAARLLERLLGECPHVRILTTSREPVGIAGEASIRVPSLDEAAATQLFFDRARAADSGFEMKGDAIDAVADVCRRLDGIPLAIELAASRVRSQTPREIADGLADRFRLLTGGSRTALPRQRTLEASVDWSYRLLSDQERTLLNRLSVFAGGFTFEAARRVCADASLPESSLLDLLCGLVDKSLAQMEPDAPNAVARYRMLETIRHFARERLADGTDAEAVRDRHVQYFLRLVEDAGPRIERTHELEALTLLDIDIDNIRAALDWSEQRGESDLLLRFGGALWVYYELRCRFDEGTGWLRTALDASPDLTEIRARALYGLGELSLFTLDAATSAACGDELMALGEHLADRVISARGVTLLGWAASLDAYRDTAWAVGALGAMFADLDDRDNPWLYADAYMALTMCWINEGDLRAAASAADEAVTGARRSGMLAPLQRALYFRGWVHEFSGEIDAGMPLLTRSLEVADELDEAWFRSVTLVASSLAKFCRSDTEGAEQDATTGLALGARYGNPVGVALGTLSLARYLAHRGEDAAALACLEREQEEIEELSFFWFVDTWFQGAHGLIEARRGEYDVARRRLDGALRAVQTKPLACAVIGVSRGWVDRMAGDDAAAESTFTEALEAAARSGGRGEVVTA